MCKSRVESWIGGIIGSQRQAVVGGSLPFLARTLLLGCSLASEITSWWGQSVLCWVLMLMLASLSPSVTRQHQPAQPSIITVISNSIDDQVDFGTDEA